MVFFTASEYHKMAITYDDHSYIICLSNKKILVVKKARESSTTLNGNDTETNLINV